MPIQSEPGRASGIRGCVRSYLFQQMLDAVPGSFKILICDSTATRILNSCMRVHELMEHGVTLLEDLMTPRQPIINSPAIYFFVPEDASVNRIIEEWSVKDPYKEIHIFALNNTPDRFLQQLAQSRMASKVKSYKDMMLDFSAPETLVFHLNMQNEIPQFFSPVLPPSRELVLDIAASRLLSVFHTLNNGVPVIRYQGRSNICEAFAKTFLSKFAKLCHDIPEFKNGSDGSNNPIVIILDRSFDSVAALIHDRTYQSLLEDLMPLENNMYEQSFKNRLGEESKRQFVLDEEDLYWCQYRHRFFAHCLQELPTTLKKLHQENPTLAQGVTQAANVAELGSAVRALPEFQEKQGKLSLHIDICTKLMAIYRENRLAEVCEVEQDIAAGRKNFKTNFENVRRLVKDLTIPQSVRLRLSLLLAAGSDTTEFSQMKKQQLIQESGIMGDVSQFANIDRITSRVGKLRKESAEMDQKKKMGSSATGDAEGLDGDPFINQAYLIMEALAKNTLSTADYPVLNSPYESMMSAGGTGMHGDSAGGKKTLRMGLALAAMRRDASLGAEDGNGGGGGGKFSLTLSSPRNTGKKTGILELAGGAEGSVTLTSNQRIVVFVLGGVTCGEMRAAYEISKKLGREVIIGGTSILRPEVFIKELNDLK
ncbi:syntaxin binding protein 1 [Trypanosoma theileri]|uniref:Syntaxin binding protein 1 n=1 Tax=Trypanosoma theileri TaxID=67003 RepID=A0A1X0P7K8_9TRYP|nr:syntaxin binding protein 1 [Trypanosoma theileri]ORC92821.1 syntaxin binding protein 1 [Trypanosoma theileri]